MQVKVEQLDGTLITPMYEPEHKDAVFDIYLAKLINGEILSFELIEGVN